MKRLVYALLPIVFALSLSDSSAAHAQPRFEPRARLLTGFTSTHTDTSSTHAFDVDDLELGLRFDWSEVLLLDVQLDAARSSSPESLFGIEGNSLIFVLRRAYGALALPLGPGRLELRLGLLPDPIISIVETSTDLRVIANALADTGGFLPRSDLGLSLGYTTTDRRFGLTLALTNGEGAADVERDTPKDLSLSLSFDPLIFELFDQEARLRILLAGRLGTRGVGSVDHQSASTFMGLVHRRLHLGLEAHYASGYADRAEVKAVGLAATTSFSPLPAFAIVGRLDWLDPDLDLARSNRTTLDVGIVLFVARLLVDLSPDLAALEPLVDTVRLRLGWRQTDTDPLAAPTPGLASTGRSNAFVLGLELSSF